MSFYITRVLLVASAIFGLNSTALAKPKVAKKPVASIAAKPLSPAQLSGKVVYVLNRDVWALDPQTRQKFLLYKDLFFPANQSPEKFARAYPFTYPVGVDFEIAWNLSRTQVAFVQRDGVSEGSELWVMNWNGNGKRQVSKGHYESIISNPQWSPDGKTLLFDENSLYREGGPGFDTTQVGIANVDGTPAKFKLGTLEGTTSFPYWSRDGDSILYYFSPESADFAAPETVSRKVTFLDGTPDVDFKENWSDFLVDNQSRNGKWRVERKPAEAYWALYQSDVLMSEAFVWREYQGFAARKLCPANDGQQFIFDGGFPIWHIDAQGITTATNFWGIWSKLGYNSYDPVQPRLLVKDGNLVDWFDDSK